MMTREFERGQVVQYIDGAIGTVVGHKNEGPGRGYSTTVRFGDRDRHIRPSRLVLVAADPTPALRRWFGR